MDHDNPKIKALEALMTGSRDGTDSVDNAVSVADQKPQASPSVNCHQKPKSISPQVHISTGFSQGDDSEMRSRDGVFSNIVDDASRTSGAGAGSAATGGMVLTATGATKRSRDDGGVSTPAGSSTTAEGAQGGARSGSGGRKRSRKSAPVKRGSTISGPGGNSTPTDAGASTRGVTRGRTASGGDIGTGGGDSRLSRGGNNSRSSPQARAVGMNASGALSNGSDSQSRRRASPGPGTSGGSASKPISSYFRTSGGVSPAPALPSAPPTADTGLFASSPHSRSLPGTRQATGGARGGTASSSAASSQANTQRALAAAAPPQAPTPPPAALVRQLHDSNAERAALQEHIQTLQTELARQQQELVALSERAHNDKKAHSEKQGEVRSRLEEFVRDLNRAAQRALRRALMDEQHRIGRVVPHRTGPQTVIEAWEDGVEVRNAREEAKRIAAKIEELTKLRRTMTRGAKKRPSSATPTSSGEPGTPNAGPGNFTNESSLSMGPPSVRANALTRDVLAELGAIEREDSVRMQLSALKREESKLSERISQLEHSKALLIKELKRVRDEDASALAHRPTLNERYLLLSMLGKGGFSEVWKALDLTTAKEVAVKVHQLNPSWGESKKQNYIRHATREYAIHKTLLHPHVVKLHDVFEIDMNSFATVLEYCRGTDLDHVLKGQGCLPEREARAIIMQVLSALRYLNKVDDDAGSGGSMASAGSSSGDSSSSKRGRIIHYDLKPANILFDESRAVKVTDFGLSKIMDDSSGPEASSMELTSQGAGTYYYLPPECFQTGAAPRISSKVDVWSVGVILYQMLFGKRPFGEGQSQQAILDEKIILRAHDVYFPAKPSVTPEAKAFIKRCLTHAAALRPDVAAICADPYLRLKLK